MENVAELKRLVAAQTGWRDLPMPAEIEGELADAIMDAPCNWKGDPDLHDAILMGHTMACEQGAVLAMKYLAAPVFPPLGGVATAAARDVLAERLRQVSVEDWTPEHDDAHPSGEIAAFAALYAMPPAARSWPAADTGYGDTFGAALCPDDWQPKFGDRRRELVKAGALLLAEIERLDRASHLSGDTPAEGGAQWS